MNYNNDGLRVFVDGQPVVGILTFLGLYYGSYIKTVEIHRGPSAYVYSPFYLNWEALCDGDHFSVTIPFTVSFVQTCARAEFHRKLTSFAITGFKYGLTAIHIVFVPRSCSSFSCSSSPYDRLTV